MGKTLRSWVNAIFRASGNWWLTFQLIISLQPHHVHTCTIFHRSMKPSICCTKTQKNSIKSLTWMATIHTSGGCAERQSLRILCSQYPWMPLCSVGRPGLWQWPHSWAWVTLCRWRHDNLHLPWDEYRKVVVVEFLWSFLLLFMLIIISEESTGYNSKQEHHDSTTHHFIWQNPAHTIPWQASLPCLPHYQ